MESKSEAWQSIVRTSKRGVICLWPYVWSLQSRRHLAAAQTADGAANLSGGKAKVGVWTTLTAQVFEISSHARRPVLV
jgi:hypothetical protein